MTCSIEEHEALVKIANGNEAVGRENMRRLFMLRLVERQLGRVQLTRAGEHLLGLHD